MTILNQNAYDSSVHFSLEDVALHSRATSATICLTIKQSKTDPFCKGVKFCLGRTNSVLCLVKVLLTYFTICESSPGCWFISKDQTPLTRAQFKTLLSATLRTAGLEMIQAKLLTAFKLNLPPPPKLCALQMFISNY